ncbi:HD-GYP domain-containing protein [Alginatibacterium sediminis]|uniref:HD-GYP domain-containing protein n=1 Tax=Alginatibacterium sediminis TaxID=2164068 RepID=A0A420E8C2_9ALTE|nr:HD-GYP domain-containing protein [Alginatibacterium sediminis]RKF14423.1 HD-GYP domain-containing protein [Alginatibacterium sediminis]
MSEIQLEVSRLQVGIYVKLPSKWGEHPFMFSNFKIRDEGQIAVIRSLGLERVTVVPGKSACAPLPLSEVAKPGTDEDKKMSADDAQQALWKEKKQRIEDLKTYRRDLQKVEKEFDRSVSQVRSVMKKLKDRPLNAIGDAQQLIDAMAEDISGGSGLILHLMGDGKDQDNFYYHSLNVSLLGMMLANAAGLTKKEVGEVGMAGLIHDVGKIKIPSQILRKTTPLSKQERNLLKMHTKYGADILNLGDYVPDKVRIVASQHHEYLDGSGYPLGLKKNKILKYSQIITIVNDYDSLCHPDDPSKARIPFTVISYLFKNRKEQLNTQFLGVLIRLLGIYPPGSIVELSSGQIGIVLSVNSKRLLYPTVQVYDENVPKDQAPIVDLETEGLSIEKALKPSTLEQDVCEYLSPRLRANYYYSAGK